MTRLITIALLTLTLTGCDTVILPAYFTDPADHTLDCKRSECRTGEMGSWGKL